MNLRTYQQVAATSVIQKFRDYMSLLIVMATGTGKTVLLSYLVGLSKRGRVLVIAHREELINQLAATLRTMTTHDVGIEMADQKAEENYWSRPQVVVATVQTLVANECARLKDLVADPNEWSLTVIDEAHHAPANTYRMLLEHMSANEDHKILGVTATPDRRDKLAMGSVFDEVAYEYGIENAVRDGWLVAPRPLLVRVSSLDYTKVRTTAGDLNGADLARVMEEERNLHAIATPTLELTNGRSTVVFCASVDQARMLADILNRHEPECARHVHGGTPKPERRMIFRDFEQKKFRFLCNCAIATEGWDSPLCSAVVVAAPTKSRSRYVQQIGRGLRPLSGLVDSPTLDDSPEARKRAIEESEKQDCLILDFVGNSGKHKLVTVTDILGGKWPEPVRRRADELLEQDPDLSVEDALEQAEEDIEAEAERKRLEEAARRSRLKAKADYNTRSMNPFDVLDIAAPVTTSSRPASNAQCEFLMKQGVDATSMSHEEAERIKREVFRRWKHKLCSLKQARLLKKYGYSTDATREEAGAIITRLKSQGWRN